MTLTEQQLKDAAAQAQRESWPMNDPRANYDAANRARDAQAEGANRRG